MPCVCSRPLRLAWTSPNSFARLGTQYPARRAFLRCCSAGDPSPRAWHRDRTQRVDDAVFVDRSLTSGTAFVQANDTGVRNFQRDDLRRAALSLKMLFDEDEISMVGAQHSRSAPFETAVAIHHFDAPSN
jgi:hypothetical protein